MRTVPHRRELTGSTAACSCSTTTSLVVTALQGDRHPIGPQDHNATMRRLQYVRNVTSWRHVALPASLTTQHMQKGRQASPLGEHQDLWGAGMDRGRAGNLVGRSAAKSCPFRGVVTRPVESTDSIAKRDFPALVHEYP